MNCENQKQKRSMNTSILVHSLRYININHEKVVRLSTWINQELIKRLVTDAKIKQSLEISDIDIVMLLVPYIKDTSSLTPYISIYYHYKTCNVLNCMYILTIDQLAHVNTKKYAGEIIKLLLKHGATLSTLLELMCYEKDFAFMKSLIEYYPSITEQVLIKMIKYDQQEYAKDIIKLYPKFVSTEVILCICQLDSIVLLQCVVDNNIDISNVCINSIMKLQSDYRFTIVPEIINILIQNRAKI